MMNLLKTFLSKSAVILLIAFGLSGQAFAETPQTREDGVTVIHLDEFNGYFAAKETLASLKAGTYEFVITNKAKKLVGFQIQDLATKTNLDMFPLEPGQTRISKVKIGSDGVRFRCPINPTPWYDIDTIK